MNKQKHTQITALLICFSLILSYICIWLLPSLFETWNLQAVDRLFQYRMTNEKFNPEYNNDIVHIDLNDTSIQDFNNYYIDRSYYTKVIKNLSSMGVKAQLHDFVFVAPSNKNLDKRLIQAVKNTDNVYFGIAFRFNNPGFKSDVSVAIPVDKYLDQTAYSIQTKGNLNNLYIGKRPIPTFISLANSSKGLGFLNIESDIDGVFRRIPLIVKYKNHFYPSLAFRAVCDLLKIPAENIIITPGKSIFLKNVKKSEGSQIQDIVIPIDKFGNMRINFVGAWEKMKHYNFSDIYYASDFSEDLELWTDELSGKIVIVSDVSSGSSDLGPIPIDKNYPLAGLHANTVNTILTESFIYEMSTWGMLAIKIAISIIMFFLSIFLSSVWFAIGSISIILGYFSLASFLFLSNQIILNLINPSLMIIFTIVFVLSYRFFNEEKEKEVLRRSFEAYFPPSIVKKLIRNPKLMTFKGEKKELTVLFSDVVQFTSHSANMAPEKVQQLLNEYFGAMTKIVFKHQGTVDKFIGDGLMVFFGDPEPMKDHAIKCVQSAIEMQKKTAELRELWIKRGDMPLEIRIGINTGTVFVGNMGSPQRLSYTVLGDEVNKAQRLESNAAVNGIMISKRTKDLIDDQIKIKSLGKIELKGFKDPVPVFEVIIENT